MDKQIARIMVSLKQLPIRTLLLEFWRDPRKRGAISAAVLAAYLLIQKSLRYRRLKRLQRVYRKYTTREEMASMTDHDAWEIQKQMLAMEFPSATLKALQFALFRVPQLHLYIWAELTVIRHMGFQRYQLSYSKHPSSPTRLPPSNGMPTQAP